MIASSIIELTAMVNLIYTFTLTNCDNYKIDTVLVFIYKSTEYILISMLDHN